MIPEVEVRHTKHGCKDTYNDNKWILVSIHVGYIFVKILCKN